MKIALIVVGVLLGGFLALSIVSATPLVGEVVKLHTRSEAGDWQTTPLWVVDTTQGSFLRAGMPDESRWFARLRTSPDVRLERAGELRSVRLVPDPSMRKTVNQLMAKRYGWADDFVGLMRDVSGSLPLRIEPASSP